MRIAFFTETFLPNIDGIVVKVCHVLDHAEKRGHQNILFAPRNHTPPNYQNTPVITRRSVPSIIYPGLRLVNPLTNVQQELETFKPDLVHLFNPTALGIAGLRAAQHLNIPVTASYHTDVSGFAEDWGFGFMHKPIHIFYRSIHNRCDLNVCPSEFTREELIQEGYQRVKVWKGGVDIERFNPAHRSQEWRQRLTEGHPDQSLAIYVSRISREKHPELLLPLVKTIPGLRLAIIGDGPYLPETKKLFAGTPTVFTGYLTGHDLAQAYAAGDIFVFTGAHETFGNVVVEAMASGLPAVVPNSGGVTDLVIPGENGLRFEPFNQGEMIEQVRFLVDNKPEARCMGRRGRELAEARAWDIVLDELFAFFQQVVDSGPHTYHPLRTAIKQKIRDRIP